MHKHKQRHLPVYHQVMEVVRPSMRQPADQNPSPCHHVNELWFCVKQICLAFVVFHRPIYNKATN